MFNSESRHHHALLVAAGAVAWGLLLLVVWAIHPIDAVARIVVVENPTAVEQASIDAVLAASPEFEAGRIERFQCESTPLDAAVGDAQLSAVPQLEPGFEYQSTACSREYGAARTALWANALVIAIVVLVAAAVAVRQRRQPNTADGSSGDQVSVNV
ncbi:MAG: hypothetical protein AB8G14_10450 [Ilumatobacter sp.]